MGYQQRIALLVIGQEKNAPPVSRILIRQFFYLTFDNGGISEGRCEDQAGKGLNWHAGRTQTRIRREHPSRSKLNRRIKIMLTISISR
ncbi:MAG: hypothetical protein WAQ29_11385 [Nitrososphaeraceae archaeon]